MSPWIGRAAGVACLVGGIAMAVQNGGNQNVLIGGFMIAALGVLMLTVGDPRK